MSVVDAKGPVTAGPDQPDDATPSSRDRRPPARGERLRDAERSRELLLRAAMEEFGARGFAGARVQDIATRAGVNKQLVSYYFGGKSGLYRALRDRWLETEAALADPEHSLDTLVAQYARAALSEPLLARLLIWSGLEDADDMPGGAAGGLRREDIEDLRRRQQHGELAADLDPLAVALAVFGAVLAPIMLPAIVREITGNDPESPEFMEHYAEQLRRIARHLAAREG